MDIHSTAIIDPKAELGENVVVNPYAIIEADTQIGDRCIIGAYAVVRTGSRLGAGTHIHTGAVLGELPQDMKFSGASTYLIIGENNHIREFVTMHRASVEGAATRIGDSNLLMAYSHIGHDCRLGSNIIMANNTGISGHCIIEDYVNIGGIVGIHQFVTIGTMAMVGGFSKVVRDVPPYMVVDGITARPRGVNVRGLQRHDMSSEQLSALKHAYRVLYRSGLTVNEAIRQIQEETEPTAEVQRLIDFMRHIDEGYRGRQADPH